MIQISPQGHTVEGPLYVCYTTQDLICLQYLRILRILNPQILVWDTITEETIEPYLRRSRGCRDNNCCLYSGDCTGDLEPLIRLLQQNRMIGRSTLLLSRSLPQIQLHQSLSLSGILVLHLAARHPGDWEAVGPLFDGMERHYISFLGSSVSEIVTPSYSLQEEFFQREDSNLL